MEFVLLCMQLLKPSLAVFGQSQSSQTKLVLQRNCSNYCMFILEYQMQRYGKLDIRN